MKLRLLGLVLLGFSGAVLTLPTAWAGDKKDEPKKEEKKAGKPGETVVNDVLINADAMDKARNGSFCKVYTFKMAEGKTYQFDMTSMVFDSYLRIEDPQGVQVAFDDDGGGYPSARIVYRAPKAGEYSIIATTFGQGSTGKFTLTIRDVENK